MFYAEIKEIVIKTVQRRQRIRTIWKQRTKKNSLVQKQEADLGDNNVGLRAYSRCSVPYFFEVIKGIRSCPHKTKLVIEMGFEELLQLDDCHVPRVFAFDSTSAKGKEVSRA